MIIKVLKLYATAATIALCFSGAGGCGSSYDGHAGKDEGVGSLQGKIVNGYAYTGSDRVVAMSGLGCGKQCSGTLITNDWVLTVAHCQYWM